MTSRTPDWLLERLHAGDLPEGEAARVRARLRAEGGLSRLDALGADDAAFRLAHPAGRVLTEIRGRAGRPGPRATAGVFWRLGPAVAATVLLLLGVVLVPRTGLLGGGAEGTGTKGGPQLVVYRQRAGQDAEVVVAGTPVRAGDLLQLAYHSAGARYGVVVSVDGRGGLTLHLPEGGGSAAALSGGGVVRLPHSYELDDAPSFERFFLVTGNEPFAAAVVLDAARRLWASGAAETGPLLLPAGLGQEAVLLRKR
ncbi:MAG TPA: hypothetical protein VFG59_08140 [Anaeromyxobacter sp.]|nr:hypothetical protein [Anaeromyxobacter sp.]